MGKIDDFRCGISRIFKVLKKTAVFFAGLLFLLFASQCKNDSGSETLTEPELEVKILGHKGGGTSSFNPLHIENTLPSVEDGLKKMDGIELDVQMSLDGTLWLFHDLDLSYTSCGSAWSGTIPLLTDSEIQNILVCDGSKQSRIYKLEEIVNYWNVDVLGFYMSLHIKLDLSSEILDDSRIGGEAKYLAKMADSLAKVFTTYKHQNQVFLEVYDATFCTKIHSLIPDIKVCLLKEVTFQQQIHDALNLGYDGISCIFTEPTITAAEVKRAQESGLIVQLWTPDTEAELLTTYSLKPDFIQTNNLDAVTYLKSTVTP